MIIGMTVGMISGIFMVIPSGVLSKLLLKMAAKIVNFPINSMVMFHSDVSLPEGMGSKSFHLLEIVPLFARLSKCEHF